MRVLGATWYGNDPNVSDEATATVTLKLSGAERRILEARAEHAIRAQQRAVSPDRLHVFAKRELVQILEGRASWSLPDEAVASTTRIPEADSTSTRLGVDPPEFQWVSDQRIGPYHALRFDPDDAPELWHYQEALCTAKPDRHSCVNPKTGQAMWVWRAPCEAGARSATHGRCIPCLRQVEHVRELHADSLQAAARVYESQQSHND